MNTFRPQHTNFQRVLWSFSHLCFEGTQADCFSKHHCSRWDVFFLSLKLPQTAPQTCYFPKPNHRLKVHHHQRKLFFLKVTEWPRSSYRNMHGLKWAQRRQSRLERTKVLTSEAVMGPCPGVLRCLSILWLMGCRVASNRSSEHRQA